MAETEVKENVNKGRLVGRVPLPKGNVAVYTRGLEVNSNIAWNFDNQEWKPANFFIEVRNWIEIFDVGMRILNKDYVNPIILSQYFDISDELAEVLSEAYDPDKREEIAKKVEEMIGKEDAEKLLRAYDRMRRITIRQNARTIELYNAKRDDFVAYLLATDAENKERSRLALNDINLSVLLKLIRQNLKGLITIADPRTGQSVYIMKEQNGNNIVYRIGNSLGDNYELNVIDRMTMDTCLSQYFKTGRVRQIRVEKFRLINSEDTNRPLLGVGRVVVPLNKDIYKVYGFVSNCMYV